VEKTIKVLLFSVMALFLTACSFKSEEQAIQDAKQAAETAFNNNDVEPNKELNQYSLYLPSGLEITENEKSNLILNDGDQTFILFNNSLEDATSKLNFKAASAAKKADLIESFEDKNRFGYIRVLKIDKDSYELQVGVGGVKITTYTTRGKMDNDAEMMMNIVNSIAAPSKKK
jgi:hypothetical protein